jgi:hypothetical protein
VAFEFFVFERLLIVITLVFVMAGTILAVQQTNWGAKLTGTVPFQARCKMCKTMRFQMLPLFMLAIVSQNVIALRTLKMISGDPDALNEAHLMVTEKIDAAVEAGMGNRRGPSP